MDFFKQNLELLQESDPELARRVAEEPFPESVKVVQSKDGFPVPQVAGVTLHSQYRPLDEGLKTTADFAFNPEQKTIIFGLGFGYHIRSLLNKQEMALTVVEPLLPVFRAFMSCIDIRPFIEKVRFLVGETPACLLARLEPGDWKIFKHLPSIRIGEVYYDRLDEGIKVRSLLQERTLRVMIVNPVYGGSLPTAHHCAGALRNLGHEVATVDCEAFEQGFFSLKKVTRNPENSEILSQNFMKFMGEIAAAKAAEFQPDIILSLAQAPLTPDAIQKLKMLNIPVVFWFVEDFRTLPYWKEIVTAYDHIFTLQDGAFHDELRSKEVRDCYYLPQACYPDIHKPLASFDIYSADVSFMGAPYHNRVHSFPRLMDLDFKIWGEGWNPETPLGRHVQNSKKRVSTEESVKIYNSAKINLNLHSSTYHYGINPDGDFVNPRTFEIAACRGFQLVDQRKDLSRMFKVGDEIIAFESMDQMRAQIDYFLARPEERNAIALKAYQRVLREHTMEHRMQELLIHVFLDRKEALDSLGENDRDPLDYCVEQAGENTELGKYLKQFKGQHPFSLKTVIDHIYRGEGALDSKESIFLMLDQILKEKD
ncbi:MAG: glycosyltransferase [Nitrospinae bacterium]|nr:glycosyltransferase [Nitrospinota bacterium]MZH41286.1 glycosyltransferase [Nitrospinota bacterium]